MLDIITENIDIWSSVQSPKTSGGRGRSKNGEQTVYGIKKLRELILELAVRGKLVPQDTKDEPASVLLEKVYSNLIEKHNLKSLAKLKRDKSTIDPKEFHYHIPENWTWCELQDISIFTNGKAHEQYVTEDPSCILINSRFVSNSGDIFKYVTQRLTPLSEGDIAIVMSDVPNGRALVRCYLVKENNKYTLNQRIGGITSSEDMNLEYLRMLLDRNKYYLQYDDGKKQTNLKKIQILSCPIPVPPFNEQQRIVAKIDELMALCDQLEQQQTDSNTAHQTLVETLLGTLIESADNKELQENWSRIENHFDTLFTTEHSIDQLKQTILQLAVMGNLVPQDPNDEPASVLLKKIDKEKSRLVKEKLLKKQKPLRGIQTEEKPFELPEKWMWVRLGDITSKITDGDHKTPPRLPEGYRLLSAKNVRNGYLDFDNCDFISEEHYIKSRERCCPEANDLLIVSVGGTIGRTSLVPNDSDFALVRSVALIKPLLLNSYYLKYSMDSSLLQNSIHTRKRGGAQPCLYLSEIVEFDFSLPPLAEQHRIVAKVDELMALCDNLKEKINDAQTTQIQLADHIVEQAIA